MRKLVVLAIVTLVAVLGVAGTASANGPADHSLPPIPPEVEFNPCTGADTLVTLTPRKAVFHLSVDNAGGSHLTGTFLGDITTADGFSGRATGWFGGNDGSGGSGVEVFTATFSATMKNDSKQTVVIHGVFHITLKDGNPVVLFEVESEECRGKPS